MLYTCILHKYMLGLSRVCFNIKIFDAGQNGSRQNQGKENNTHEAAIIHDYLLK